MKDIINPLSFGSGALITAVISGVIAVAIGRIKSKKTKWIIGLIMPFLIAYLLYWSPVYISGSDPSEFSAWSHIFIIPWYTAGTFVFVLVIFVINVIKRQ